MDIKFSSSCWLNGKLINVVVVMSCSCSESSCTSTLFYFTFSFKDYFDVKEVCYYYIECCPLGSEIVYL